MICVEQRQEFFDYANHILAADFAPDKAKCVATVEDDKILGVVIFDRFTKYGCELNVASTCPRFLTRALIKLTFNYIFNICGIIRITIVIDENNAKSLKMCRGLGFVDESRLKCAYGTRDGLMLRMLRNECKWI